MVQRVILWGVIFGMVGLVFGYLVFGRIAGEYVSVSNLISLPANWVEELGETLTGVRQIRQRIFTTGVAGLVLGAVVSAVFMRK